MTDWITELCRSFAKRLVQEVKLMEQSFAQGECPNCGHDWTAHSAWIANPGDRTCVTVDPIGSECDIADELAVIVIQMEDEIVHTDEHPFCGDWRCPCHCLEAMTEFIEHPILEGLLTGDEAARLWRGQQL